MQATWSVHLTAFNLDQGEMFKTNSNYEFISIFNHHHTYRCDDTTGCGMQFWPPDDEHTCSKRVEATE